MNDDCLTSIDVFRFLLVDFMDYCARLMFAGQDFSSSFVCNSCLMKNA